MTIDSAYDTVWVHLQVALKLQIHAALYIATYHWSGSLGVDIEQKGRRSVFHDNDPDLLMTEVKCKDLPDSDWGDFRCRCAVNLV